jgi:hypothetical protein
LPHLERVCISHIPRHLLALCFHTLAHSFALTKNPSPSFSIPSALFCRNKGGGGECVPNFRIQLRFSDLLTSRHSDVPRIFSLVFSIAYTLFQVPYPVSPLLATLTKTAGCTPTIPILVHPACPELRGERPLGRELSSVPTRKALVAYRSPLRSLRSPRTPR